MATAISTPNPSLRPPRGVMGNRHRTEKGGCLLNQRVIKMLPGEGVTPTAMDDLRGGLDGSTEDRVSSSC